MDATSPRCLTNNGARCFYPFNERGTALVPGVRSDGGPKIPRLRSLLFKISARHSGSMRVCRDSGSRVAISPSSGWRAAGRTRRGNGSTPGQTAIATSSACRRGDPDVPLGDEVAAVLNKAGHSGSCRSKRSRFITLFDAAGMPGPKVCLRAQTPVHLHLRAKPCVRAADEIDAPVGPFQRIGLTKGSPW